MMITWGDVLIGALCGLAVAVAVCVMLWWMDRKDLEKAKRQAAKLMSGRHHR